METRRKGPLPQIVESPVKPAFSEALKFWWKLGWISFGGPAGQIAVMHRELVEKKKWIGEGAFLHALSYCMLLPGPEAQQLATYLGWLLHGIRGGLVAGILFILPSVFILLGLSALYLLYGRISFVENFFEGVKAAVLAVLILAFWKLAEKIFFSSSNEAAVKNKPGKFWVNGLTVLVALAGAATMFFHGSFPILIASSLALGTLLTFVFGKYFRSKKPKTPALEKNISAITVSGEIRRMATLVFVFGALWMLPIALFYFLANDFPFWKTLTLFFTQAALVTFGGAYAVLPYVAQMSVSHFHWLSASEMIDGLALGESTPGPLIMVLAFVGFLGAAHHHENSLLFGTAGLLLTVFYTFLPSFFFILAGAPWVEKTGGNDFFKSALTLAQAAVVGVIFYLALYFGKAILFPESVSVLGLRGFPLVWAAISLLALKPFKINLPLWLLASGAAGTLFHWISSSIR
ncbi:MAG: chromate efflux transporter [Spirochaetia bacterium]|nr:chromate efflux transporter [Spirochaetia bacterium]